MKTKLPDGVENRALELEYIARHEMAGPSTDRPYHALMEAAALIRAQARVIEAHKAWNNGPADDLESALWLRLDDEIDAAESDLAKLMKGIENG